MNKLAWLGQGGGAFGRRGEILWQVNDEISTCASWVKLRFNQIASWVNIIMRKTQPSLVVESNLLSKFHSDYIGFLAFLKKKFWVANPAQFSTKPPSSD